MRRTGVWQVTGKGPTELPSTTVELEKELESWIERDSGLLRRGLTIVGRQMGTEAGPLDLLAIDPEGRWVVIEIKKGAIDRLTIAQAVDYASCIAAMSAEVLERKVNAYLAAHGDGSQTLRDILPGAVEGDDTSRDVMMIVVGTGAVPGLERMAGFLSDRCGVPIDIVTFDVFTTASGERILVRELTEGPGPTTGTGSRRPVASLDQLFADQPGPPRGTLVGLTPTRGYVLLDSPPIDVPENLRDLDPAAGLRPDGVTVTAGKRLLCRLGDAVDVVALAADPSRRWWTLKVERAAG